LLGKIISYYVSIDARVQNILLRRIIMRKLIMWNVITLDGCFEGINSWDLDFHELVWGKELEDFSIDQLKSADILVFGKMTYIGMADYWTTAVDEGEIAKVMNEIQKVVCSTTLKSTSWNNTTILTDAVTEITHLKTEGNGNIFVFGSGNLPESLMKAGLFDEYRLCLSPVFLGKGKLLFNQGIQYQKLKLVEANSLANGGIILRYTPN
jgi:dihydrofolate reductase